MLMHIAPFEEIMLKVHIHRLSYLVHILPILLYWLAWCAINSNLQWGTLGPFEDPLFIENSTVLLHTPVLPWIWTESLFIKCSDISSSRKLLKNGTAYALLWLILILTCARSLAYRANPLVFWLVSLILFVRDGKVLQYQIYRSKQ